MNEIWFVHDTQTSPAARRSALERAGWKVRATVSAQDAIAWLRAGTPSVFLVDVLIEGCTGFDLCRAIRAQHAADVLPIVLACGVYQEPEHAAEAQAAGAQRYLALPVDPEELVATVTELARGDHGVRAA